MWPWLKDLAAVHHVTHFSGLLLPPADGIVQDEWQDLGAHSGVGVSLKRRGNVHWAERKRFPWP